MTCTYHEKCIEVFGKGFVCSKAPLSEGCLLSEKHKLINPYLEQARCPRSARGKALINNYCPNHDCIYFSPKLSYRCYLLHRKTFHPNAKHPDTALMHRATGVNKLMFNRLLEIGVFHTRICFILMKYVFEHVWGEAERLTKVENFDALQEELYVPDCDLQCQYCGTIQTKVGSCRCINDKKLREERLSFQKTWRQTVRKGVRRIERECGVEMPLTGTPSELVCFYANHLRGSRFIQLIITKTQFQGLKLMDIPFGYVLHVYQGMYNDSLWRTRENLGLTTKTLSHALEIFKQ